MNYKNFGNQPAAAAEAGGGGARPPGSFHLTRQGSIYSLTFDELQNTMGSSIGKDFGSMNMDELLKSIWNAEEVQTTGNNTANGVQEGGGGDGGEVIQRQGSLTLPRTLSQKTVEIDPLTNPNRQCIKGSVLVLKLVRIRSRSQFKSCSVRINAHP
ncbi:putative plant bZIP transcription factor [Helianthus annuus]|nr:putative plant bZIP transcription factor [Helianthus annuus]KAJ0719724.1 putative plant bZIP transcription factor [Helianthus annuus]